MGSNNNQVWSLLITSYFLYSAFYVASSYGAIKIEDKWRDKERLLKRNIEATVKLHKLSCSNRKSADSGDTATLTKLYHSTDGPNWFNKTNWLHGDPCKDNWYGVCCNSDGRVIGLDLYYNTLNGPIPSDVFSMNSLELVNFSKNKLNGSLPDKIEMPALDTLNLTENQLTGLAPATWNCPNLRIFGVSVNQLNGSLPKFSGLIKLEIIDLSENQFTGTLPPEYGTFISLKQLWLDTNDFRSTNEFPVSWLVLKDLEVFAIDMLHGAIPQSFGTYWPNLIHFHFAIGNLTGSIPRSICNLKKLISFAIISNPMTGDIPDCMENFPNMEYIYIAMTNLSGEIPSSLGNLKKLQQLGLRDSQLFGPIPASLVSLNTTLMYLDFSNNKLSSIDDDLKSLLHKVDWCFLSDNPFVCPIPTFASNCFISDCSKCNTKENRSSCSKCLEAKNCGWCRESPSCLEAGDGTPRDYNCNSSNWFDKKCP